MLAAYRQGRVERQVNINRDHVIAGRSFDRITELDGAFEAWLPVRRAQVHRTHGHVISVRVAVDWAASDPFPVQPYLVTEKHLRPVGKDALVTFEGQLLLRARTQVRADQRVQLQVDGE